MNPVHIVVVIGVVFTLSLIARCFALPKRKARGASRSEKNGQHLATLILALFCVGLGVVGFVIPAFHHPTLWVPVGIMLLFVLPARIIVTELGIRRVANHRPTAPPPQSSLRESP